MFKNWIKITGHAAMLGFETQQVMHLRMMKLFAGGPDAQSEALRMVTEKTSALAEATTTLARGGSAQRVIRRYRTHVRSNDDCRNRKSVEISELWAVACVDLGSPI